jgi:hypothetical protein
MTLALDIKRECRREAFVPQSGSGAQERDFKEMEQAA